MGEDDTSVILFRLDELASGQKELKEAFEKNQTTLKEDFEKGTFSLKETIKTDINEIKSRLSCQDKKIGDLRVDMAGMKSKVAAWAGCIAVIVSGIGLAISYLK